VTDMYLLDTNAISHAVRNPTGEVAVHIDRHRSAVMTSVIVESEVRFGIAQKPDSRVAGRVERFLNNMTSLPFDADAARHYGDIRALLEAIGEPTDPMDTFIAAHARSLNACLVTHNVSHFQRVPGLRWENWQGEGS